MIKKQARVFTLLFFILSLAGVSSPSATVTDEDCLTCHADPDLKTEKGKSLFVDQEKFLSSVHGKGGMSCLDCHADLRKVRDFPHPSPLKQPDCGACHEDSLEDFRESVHFREGEQGTNGIHVGCKDCHGSHDIRDKNDLSSSVFPLNLPKTCESCHLEKLETQKGADFIRQFEQSIHFRALEKSGLIISATCGSCHGGHEIKSVRDPLSLISRKNIVRTCGKCHVGIQRDYLEGVHGKDYVKGNADIPVCTDCHSEHNILSAQDLNSKVYTTKIAELCSGCHDNVALSRQYGFLTSRYKTYADTYHGTASRFGKTRVANCASCHGYHDIRDAADPKSSINPANLPRTCGNCHPGASKRFAEGSIHMVPDKIEVPKHKTSLLVKKIYIILISAFISVFLIFIAADLFRRFAHRTKHE